MKPVIKPVIPNFSSGPCAKRPGYSLAALDSSVLGRSHRSNLGKKRLAKSIRETGRLLGVPADYRIAIVPASDTGAVEMFLWSALGARPVDIFSWESFGAGWATDVLEQIGLPGARHISAPYGELPDMTQWNPEHDIVFVWNGTTSGVKLPHGNWIPDERGGLTICDATSAAFAMDLPWRKLDVIAFSWQKVLGGEGAHGILILSPRAVERLETYTPGWPLPKIFRMTKNGKLIEDLFEGGVINTPSMLANEDYLDALAWADAVGGLPALIKRSESNCAVLENFVSRTPWIDFLAKVPETRSNTSVCLSIDTTPDKLKEIVSLLEAERVAFDVCSYKDAPLGLRIWCGATVEKSDIEALLPWLEWAFEEVHADVGWPQESSATRV